jgi:hypothetical protein
MIRLKDINKQILQEDIDKAISEFYDYSYLLKEGKLQEAGVKDYIKKANDLMKFAAEKTGNAISDASINIYVKTSSVLRDKIEGLSKHSKDKKSGIMLKILGKIVGWFLKNPKSAFASIRVGLLVLSLIGSAVGAYKQSLDPDVFDSIFEKLGIDMDGSDVGSADALRDQLNDLEKLEKLNDVELGKKISQAVSNMEMDVENPEFIKRNPTGGELAPTDLMSDPAYADYQEAMDIVKQTKGDDTVRRLLNLAKLDRMLDEQLFKGSELDSGKVLKSFSNMVESNGTVQMSENSLSISSSQISYNGEVISKVELVTYRVERSGESFTIISQKVSGLQSDIDTRVEQLTKGLNKSVVDRVFSGMEKFSDWNKSGMSWKKENIERNERMMFLAGLIKEENILQKGVSAVKGFVTNVAGKAQNFLSSLKNKLSKLITNIGRVFLSKEIFARLSDGKPHNFIIKDGKLIIK